MTPRALLLLALLALHLAGCAAMGGQKSATARETDFRGRHVILWVDAAGCARALASREECERLAIAARTAGFTHLAIEARDARGRDAMPLYRHLRAAAAGAGLRLAAVLPLWIAEPGADPAHLAASARWSGTAWEIQPLDGADGSPAMLSPAVAANRAREIAAMARLAADPAVEVILLAEPGFRDAQADVSPPARRIFESWTGTTLREWPGAVLGAQPPALPYGPEGRGPLWNSWTWWRASLLRDLLLEAKGTLAALPTQPPPVLAALVDAPYPAHQRAGLNWASPGTSATGDNAWLPADYQATAAGHVLDAVALGFWEPGLAMVSDAESRGFAWWSSVEGAAAAARRYRAPGTMLWGALELDGTMGDDPALAAAARALDGVVILSASRLFPEFR